MAISSFSSGDVLTASDLNAYPGLVRLASGTFSGATVIDITGWTSSITHYRLVWDAQSAASTPGATGQFYNGATAINTAYYSSAFSTYYTGTYGIWDTRNNATNFNFFNSSTSGGSAVYDVFADSSKIQLSGTYIASAYHILNGVRRVGATFDKLRVTSSGSISGNWLLLGYNL